MLAGLLRQKGFAGDITLIAGESELPCQGPPLSKHLLDDGFAQSLRPAEFYRQQDIASPRPGPVAAGDRAIQTNGRLC